MLRVYFGHHKCGSRAVRAILRAEANRRGARIWTYDDFIPVGGPKHEFWELSEIDDPIRLADIPDGDIVCYINANPARLGEVRRLQRPFRAVEVIRDPRNVLVSAYEHHRTDHPFETPRWRWPLLEALQPALRSLDRDAGMRLEMNTTFRQVAVSQFSLAAARDPDVTLLRVEELAGDRREFVNALGESLRFGSIVDTEPVLSDPTRYRSVDPESWRTQLIGAVAEEFTKTYGSLVTELGY